VAITCVASAKIALPFLAVEIAHRLSKQLIGQFGVSDIGQKQVLAKDMAEV